MKSIFRNTLCPSYWFPPEVLSVADIFILSSLSASGGLCWALLMSNIGPCNYPMYKQLTQSRYSDPGSQYWRSSPGHGPSLHLSLHCQIRTQRGEMVRCGPNWTLSGKVSQIFLTLMIWRSCGWQRRPGVAKGRCRIIKCQYPRSPLRGSIIVYIYNLYLVCHYLIREKNSTGAIPSSGEDYRYSTLKCYYGFCPLAMSGLGMQDTLASSPDMRSLWPSVNESGNKSPGHKPWAEMRGSLFLPLTFISLATSWWLLNTHLHDKDPLTLDMWWPANLGLD